MSCNCEPKRRGGNWRERTRALNKSLPPADLPVRIRCGVRSCDLSEPRPTNIAVSSMAPKRGALIDRGYRVWVMHADSALPWGGRTSAFPMGRFCFAFGFKEIEVPQSRFVPEPLNILIVNAGGRQVKRFQLTKILERRQSA